MVTQVLSEEGNIISVAAGAEVDHRLLKSGIAEANIPALLPTLIQFTGETRWMGPRYAPTRASGLDDNDSGGLPAAIQGEIRQAATEAILAWLGGKPTVLPSPNDKLLARMLGMSMGETVPEEYGEIIAADMGLIKHHEQRSLDTPAGFHVLIVGAGISGICAAINLQRRGISCEIIEKNTDFGGTWWENRYPGAGVDTPNHIYSFSFAKNDWTRYFALRDELLNYFRSVADRFDLRKITRFDTKVEEARWDEWRSEWTVTVRDRDGLSETLTAPVLLSAVGILNVPQYPSIKGIETFTGPVVHTADWPEKIDLSDKRVALVGNGASGMQIAPAIADSVEHLTIFARSKQWVAPFLQFGKSVPLGIRYLLKTVPLYQEWYRARLMWTFNDRLHASLQKDPAWPYHKRSLNEVNDRHRQFFTDYVISELGARKDMVGKVLPDFPPYGKRILLDNGWYRTIARDNVTLIEHHLDEVIGNRLIAKSGEVAEADVIILATGFKATEFIASFKVLGRDGQALRDVWGVDNARSYIGSMVPGFPNFFTLLGPNIGLGHGGSVIKAIELQTGYIIGIIHQMLEKDCQNVEVREEVFSDYNQRVDEAHAKMVWTHEGTENWYRNSRGRVVAISPWRNDDFWRMTRLVNPADYKFE